VNKRNRDNRKFATCVVLRSRDGVLFIIIIIIIIIIIRLLHYTAVSREYSFTLPFRP